MKRVLIRRVLITGANSYIGTSFENWIAQWPERYSVETIDMKEQSWKEKDFSEYDVVFHVAGIAHVSADPKMEDLYYKVNSELCIDTAKKAKAEGVKQFIFMSSIIVYGDSNIAIERSTKPKPSNFYGMSKLKAEEGIISLENDNFKVVIIRPPMIYGKGSKGNYPKLVNAAQKLPVFPDINNQRSMLHIDNLCKFIQLMIDNDEQGVFFPQNKEYVKTSEMVRVIAESYEKKIRLIKLFNPFIKLLMKVSGLINKVFGNLVYDKNMSEYKEDYQIRTFRESIIASK